MRQQLLFGVAALVIASALLLSYHQPSAEPVPKMPRPYRVENCTETLEIECAVEVERTVVTCAKAIETEGADVIADIKCAKDLLGDKKYCWPCICALAKKKNWKIIGC